MADPRELFSTTKATSGGAGVPLDQAVDATTAAAALNGAVGFSFKDFSGNVILPQLDALGRIAVSSVTGTPVHQKGELAAGSLTLVAVTGASLTLTPTKVYTNVQWKGSCRQASLFQLIQTDDVTVTVVDEIVTGPGQYTVNFDLGDVELTAGASGTQTLSISAKNFEELSSLRGIITALEVA